VCNHLTVMAPGHDDKFLVIAYGLMWSEVTASNLLLVDKDGHVLEGDGAPEHTAFFIHSNLHMADPHNNICVLHTHQVCAQGGRVSVEGWEEECVGGWTGKQVFAELHPWGSTDPAERSVGAER
jgi:hypothetical protein